MRAYIMSIVAVVFFMSHFWWNPMIWSILWGLAAFFAIWSIYDGVVTSIATDVTSSSPLDERNRKALASSEAVMGILIFLGLTLSVLHKLPGR